MTIADMIRERAIADAISKLCKKARACDNLWLLQRAINCLDDDKALADMIEAGGHLK